jgi:FtsP/CotA-like multicopper oxidase with cupredoxin domain
LNSGFINNGNNLPIPPQITGVVNEQGQKVFDLTLQKGKKTFLPDTQTDTFGINGDYLGPTIRLSRGERALFKINNQVGEETTIHWHGLHIPAKMDGGPHQVIEPGSTWQPFFEIKQLAATLWYHSHLEGKTAEHVYKGLAGLFIVDDAKSDQLALPHNYGVDDIPVVVQDRRIAADGNMDSTLTNMIDRMGLRGQYMLINGALTPTLETRAQVIRLRVLNGSNARIYNFGFADNRSFYQIASGGGLLQAPVAMNRLRLSPGERAEILLDLRQDSGKFLRLQSYSAEITPTTIETANMRDPLDMQTFDLMSIRVGEAGNNGLDIPNQLVTIETLRAEDAVLTRPFILKQGMGGNMGNRGMGSGGTGNMEGMFTINDKSMDMLRIDETVRLGDTEIWAITNEANMAHPFHIHDIQFQILDRNGQAPSAGEAGWKDTVLVLPNETVRVITRFEDFADADIPYMYHCHILEHEDAGMMGQFVVIP